MEGVSRTFTTAIANLFSVTHPDGKVRIYAYEDPNFTNLLTGIVDELGNAYETFTYDSQGRAVSTQSAGGADLTTLAYNADGSVTVTDARGNARNYTLTSLFNVVKPVALTGTPYPAAGGAAFSYDRQWIPGFAPRLRRQRDDLHA